MKHNYIKKIHFQYCGLFINNSKMYKYLKQKLNFMRAIFVRKTTNFYLFDKINRNFDSEEQDFKTKNIHIRDIPTHTYFRAHNK